MESANQSPFDPHFNAQLLAEIGNERSVEDLLKKIVSRLGSRADIRGVQIWMLDPAERSLSLVAAEGVLPPEVDPLHTRIPVGQGILGETAARSEEVVLCDYDPDWQRVGNLDWLKQQRIRGFMGGAVTHKREVLGVAAVYFDHHPLAVSHPWNRIYCNHIGAAIAGARAFEEIQKLKNQLEQQNAYLQEEVIEARAFGELVGQSGALRQIVGEIDLVSATEASVLILGETGTGKELVAREIHRRSPRREKPLVRVNCASIPKDLFESEFFGHVRGAFTGAIKDRAGRFETAHGGTIFLDEVGEIPLEMQSKLLRVLQERRYERVGDDRTRYSDVRIIAATNRNLKNEAAAGRFREDLFYRLNVFPIEVPPLRERLEDIPALAKHFVELSVRELRCPKPRITQAGLASLQNYSWPGNIRELRNVIERAVILARGKALEFDLPVTAQTTSKHSAKPIAHNRVATDFLTKAELQRLERDNLLRALEAANWKIKGPDGAAELFGLKPTTLLSKMEKWGLKKPERDSAR
ncbi:MAG: sigma 54-interacting transcriptional regulator [Verrucomicrobiota bacterium]|nr:sigma 54-interacting transcriptional regulator [Verrucomicrobiota bacterium]